MKNLISWVLLLGLVTLSGLLGACSLNLPQSSASKVSHEVLSEENSSAESQTVVETEPPAGLIEDLKTILATELGIADSEVLVRETEAVEWSDACLGAAKADEVCAQVVTPGYRIVLATLTEEFEFHTDRTGRNFRRVEPQQSESSSREAEVEEPTEE